MASECRQPAAALDHQVRQQDLLGLAGWLRSNTPPTQGYLDTSSQPEYGILGSWDIGHALRYQARRPLIRDNFATHFLAGRRYFSAVEEERANALLEDLRGRYVIADRLESMEQHEGSRSGSMIERLYWFDGSEYRIDSGPLERQRIKAVERYRLVYESPIRRRERSPPSATFKVFEFVPGARIRGRASPGAEIRLSLPLLTNQGRRVTYTSTIVAGDDEGYEFLVPYSNGREPPSVWKAAHYTLRCDRSGLARMPVPETAIASGDLLPGPELCR